MVLWKTLFHYSHLLLLVLTVFLSPLPESLSWEEGCDTDVPFVAEHSTVSYPLHIDQLRVSVLNYCLLQASLIPAERCTHLLYSNSKGLGVGAICARYVALPHSQLGWWGLGLPTG